MVWSGSPVEATRLLVAEAERCSEHDPALAAAMLADAANACTVTNSYHRAEALACRAVALLGDRQRAGGARARAGDARLGARAARKGSARATGAARRPSGWPRASIRSVRTGRGCTCCCSRASRSGELERARARRARPLCDARRDAGALATLGGALVVAADAAFRLGDWDAADERGARGDPRRRRHRPARWHGYALTHARRLAGARGHPEEARDGRSRPRSRIAESAGMRSGQRFAHGALGFVELSSGRVDEAIAELETVERHRGGLGARASRRSCRGRPT